MERYIQAGIWIGIVYVGCVIVCAIRETIRIERNRKSRFMIGDYQQVIKKG